jgi:hypothetical protein
VETIMLISKALLSLRAMRVCLRMCAGFYLTCRRDAAYKARKKERN